MKLKQYLKINEQLSRWKMEQMMWFIEMLKGSKNRQDLEKKLKSKLEK